MATVLEKWRSASRRLKSETYALFLAYKDPRVPWYAKLFAATVLAYAFSPIDLIPDFIPVIGYLDDLIIVPAGVALALRMIPAGVMDDARMAADEAMGSGKPVNWFMAGAIILIWLAIALIGILLLSRVLVSKLGA